MKPRDSEPANPLRYAYDFISPGSGGRRIFALLLPDSCGYHCSFCPVSPPSRLPNDLRSPSGLARVFLSAFRRGLCDGLYLTAGVPRIPLRAAGALVGFVELLRVDYGYRGYLHVKSVAGAAPGQVQKLVHLADRVSYHLEPACSRAVLTQPTARLPKGMELFESVDRAARELRAALAESARRAPGPLPPAGGVGFRRTGQMPLFGGGSAAVSAGSVRR